MVSKRDSKPILVKFPKGTKKNDKLETLYEDDWNVVYGLIGEPNGLLQTNVYGNDLPFDKLITVNAGSITRRIGYDSAIMLDDMPTSNYPKGDYYIRRIFPEYNGEIRIGLMKVTAVDMPKLYFESNGEILYTQLNFDKDTLIAYTASNAYTPLNLGLEVWTRKPSDILSDKHKYRVVGINKVGFDGGYTPFNQYTLQKVEENGEG